MSSLLAPDHLVCPICGSRTNYLTSSHIRKHGYTVREFKEKFNIAFLKAASLREKQAAFMRENSPTKGRKRTPDEIDLMQTNRLGKGVGVCGKYLRTDEIRKKISLGVSKFMIDHPDQCGNSRFKSEWVEMDCAAPKVWVRSSWEKRVLQVLDQQDDIDHVWVEPLRIPYELHGISRTYTPDFMIEFDCGIRELWEVKPIEFVNTEENIQKFNAARALCSARGWNFRVVTLEDIERMEALTERFLSTGEKSWL